MFSVFTLTITFFFLIFLLPIAQCKSKKKFQSDARAELIPKSPDSTKKEVVTSQSCPPTAQTPPAHTPVEKTGKMEEDTLDNVKTLQMEKSVN